MVLSIIKRFLVTEDLFEFNLKFLSLVGLWPDENLSPFQMKLYKLYENTFHSFMIIYIILTGIGTIQCTDNTIKFLSNIDKSIVSFNYVLKVICFINVRYKLKYLIEDINKSGDKVKNKSSDNMIKLLISTTSLVNGTIGIFTLVGLINNEMVIEAWMPFDPYANRTNLYISTEILALLFSLPFVCRAMGIQGIVCSLLIYLCDQLDELQEKIRRLQCTKENEQAMRKEFVMIIKKHIRIMRYSNSMENMFKMYFLIQNFAVTLELCFNAVLVSTVNMDQRSVIFGFLVFLGLALLNAYLYCSLGNDLEIKSQEIAQAAFDSKWTSWPVDLRKSVLLIITVAQRPLKMSAGGVDTINIQTYCTALYNGYTIFAVLNDVVN